MVMSASGTRVRVVTSALPGDVLTDTLVATKANHHFNFEQANAEIEGISIKAGLSNGGLVWVLQMGRDSGDNPIRGYPLSAGQTLSLDIARLSQLRVLIVSNGNMLHYVAVRSDRS